MPRRGDIKKVMSTGSGPIVIGQACEFDYSGTQACKALRSLGYDLEMTRAAAEAATIPVIASGGAGKLEHLYEAATVGKASAVLSASIFHFGEISIAEARRYLQERGIPLQRPDR